MTDVPRVQIHYKRPPDRLRVYDQRVALERDDVIITLSEPIQAEEPMVHDGTLMLESGSLAVWFTFPGVWHDIGHFHCADGTFSGLYANILTPPIIDGPVWHTTDLFLDVWWPASGPITLLDEDEFAEAIDLKYIDSKTADRARAEADRLLELGATGEWPPPVVQEWTLDRTLAHFRMRSKETGSS
jgi:uncharacterized protein